VSEYRWYGAPTSDMVAGPSKMFTLTALRGEGTVSSAISSHPVTFLVKLSGGKTRGMLIGGRRLGSDGNVGSVCVADQILSSFEPTVANRMEFV